MHVPVYRVDAWCIYGCIYGCIWCILPIYGGVRPGTLAQACRTARLARLDTVEPSRRVLPDARRVRRLRRPTGTGPPNPALTGRHPASGVRVGSAANWSAFRGPAALTPYTLPVVSPPLTASLAPGLQLKLESSPWPFKGSPTPNQGQGLHTPGSRGPQPLSHRVSQSRSGIGVQVAMH